MKISCVETPSQYKQYFMHFKARKFLHIKINALDVIKDNAPSLVCKINQGEYILKCVKPRRIHEFSKMLWGRSRLSKEIKGNFVLKKLGLRTPEIIDIGYGFIPTLGYKYLGYYIMDNIENTGFLNADHLIKGNYLSKENRQIFIHNVFNDLKVMMEHGVIFSDLKLKNIHSDLEGNTNWIDTGITRYSIYNKKKFAKKFNGTLQRFLRISSDYLYEEEKELFLQLTIS